jgi:hypothetical protein
MTIYEQIEERFRALSNDQWQTNVPDVIRESGIKLDCYFEDGDKVIIAEIYATIGKAKSAKKRKLASDCFKMLYAEKLLSPKIVEKRFITVDDEVWRKEIENIWQSKCLNALGIKLEFFKITPEERESLQDAINKNKKSVKEMT